MPSYIATLETHRRTAYNNLITHLEKNHAVSINIPTFDNTLRLFHYRNTTILIGTHSTFVTIYDPEKQVMYEAPNTTRNS